MSKTISTVLANVFSGLFGASEPAAIPTSDRLAIAQAKLDKGICPNCDESASFDSVAIDPSDDCQHSTEMCLKCGERFKLRRDGKLLSFEGFDAQIRTKYESDNVDESKRRAAVLASDLYARRHAA